MSKEIYAIHPPWLRVTHWLYVVAVVILVMSGWRIYDASPFFPFFIPKEITLGGWLGGALQWHFAAMWLLAVNGLIYLFFNIFSGRLWHKFFPLSLRAIVADLLDALKGRIARRPQPLTHRSGHFFCSRLAVVAVIVLSAGRSGSSSVSGLGAVVKFDVTFNI